MKGHCWSVSNNVLLSNQLGVSQEKQQMKTINVTNTSLKKFSISWRIKLFHLGLFL
jgi:hypothetical protein